MKNQEKVWLTQNFTAQIYWVEQDFDSKEEWLAFKEKLLRSKKERSKAFWDNFLQCPKDFLEPDGEVIVTEGLEVAESK